MTAGQTIAAAARLWLKHNSPWMTRAKRELTAFSPAMVELGLRELFTDIAANVEELERREVSCSTLHAPRSTVCHILSGNLPNSGIVSVVIGLLSGVQNVVKPATGDPMPALFMESLATVDPKLARRVRLTRNREAHQEADIVVAYGDDGTLSSLQKCRRRGARDTFLRFGHRVSIGMVNFSHSAGCVSRSAIAAAARDASLWDQQGCMSPQCFYVRGDAAAFAGGLAREMERFDRLWPRVELDFANAAAIARARNEWSFRGRVWASSRSTHWTVVLDERDGWASSPLNRFVFVRPIELLTPKLGKQLPLSTVGFVGFSLKEVVAMARADRYCSLGEMQRPSLLLTHGSRPRVGDLIV